LQIFKAFSKGSKVVVKENQQNFKAAGDSYWAWRHQTIDASEQLGPQRVRKTWGKCFSLVCCSLAQTSWCPENHGSRMYRKLQRRDSQNVTQ